MALTAVDRLHFLRSFLRSPRNVGSLIPSSERLASAMVAPIDFSTAKMVVELGAGTGVFTQPILRAISPGTRVLVFERDDLMRRRLADRYPSLELFPDALELSAVVGSTDEVDSVICSLPFANFPRVMRAQLVQSIHSVLRPGGQLVAVQYSLQMRRALRELFDEVSIAFVPLNVPPAFVYTCTKRRDHAL
jgi:phospholipid N-methyltransferase